MTSFQIVLAILLGILVAAIIPVLVQVRRTLRRAEEVLSVNGPKLGRTLDEASEAAARINRLGATLERDAEGLRVFSDAAAGLGRTLRHARDSVRSVTSIGTAIVPAIVAGLRALFAPAREEEFRPSPRRKQAPAAAEGEGDGHAIEPSGSDADVARSRSEH